jgi:hypothetical protein
LSSQGENGISTNQIEVIQLIFFPSLQSIDGNRLRGIIGVKLECVNVPLKVVAVDFIAILVERNLLDCVLFRVQTFGIPGLGDPLIKSSILELVEFPKAKMTFLIPSDIEREVRMRLDCIGEVIMSDILFTAILKID